MAAVEEFQASDAAMLRALRRVERRLHNLIRMLHRRGLVNQDDLPASADSPPDETDGPPPALAKPVGLAGRRGRLERRMELRKRLNSEGKTT